MNNINRSSLITNEKMNEILSKNSNFTNTNFRNFDQFLFQNREHLRDELLKKNEKFKKAYENYENKLLKQVSNNELSNNNWTFENLQAQVNRKNINNGNHKRGNNNVNTSFAPGLLKNQFTNVLQPPPSENTLSNENLMAELNALNIKHEGGKRKRKTKQKKKKKVISKKPKSKKVHKGPRGGKYVMVKGKKKYL